MFDRVAVFDPQLSQDTVRDSRATTTMWHFARGARAPIGSGWESAQAGSRFSLGVDSVWESTQSGSSHLLSETGTLSLRLNTPLNADHSSSLVLAERHSDSVVT